MTTTFDRVTKGRQIARIDGVIRAVWEHDSAHGDEASRIVDPRSPGDAWIETSDPENDLVDVRAADGSDLPTDDEIDAGEQQ